MPDPIPQPDKPKNDQDRAIEEDSAIKPSEQDIHFIKKCLTMSDSFIMKAPQFMKIHNIPEEMFQQLAMEAIVDNLCANELSKDLLQYMSNISILQKVFNLSPETVNENIRKAVVNCLSVGRVEQVDRIKAYFNLPEDFFNSSEVQKAAEEGLVTVLSSEEPNYGIATQIVESINLSKELVWEASKVAIVYQLTHYLQYSFETAIEIIKILQIPESIYLSEEVKTAAKQKLIDNIMPGFVEQAKIIIDFFKISEEDIKLLITSYLPEMIENKLYQYLFIYPGIENYLDSETIENLYDRYFTQDTDNQVQNNFIFLQNIFGKSRLREILYKQQAGFWQNPHDHLLFVEKITSLPEKQQQKIANLILKPLLSTEIDFRELDEYFGYFDVDIYIAKKDGEEIPFNNWQEFIREANLQRYDIQIPEDASDEFKDAMELFISTKGINVPFLRTLSNEYSKEGMTEEVKSDEEENQDVEVDVEEEDWEDDYEDQENLSSFAHQLIEIIEGRDDIDSRKMIAPLETSMPFDPVHRLVYTSIGLHSLNSLTPGFTEFSKDRNGLGAIVSLLEMQDKETAKKLRERRDEKTKSNPEKKDRHQAEFAKELANGSFIRKKAGGEVEGIAIENCTDLQYRLGEDQYDLVKQALRIALDSQISVQTKEGEKILSFKDQLIRSLTTLSSRREAISNVIDLIKFEELAIIGEKISKLMEEKEGTEISSSELFELLEGKEVETALFTAYLGLNNRKRYLESRQIKKELDQILNQQRYKEKNQKLKDQGEADQKNDVFLSYINGKIQLEGVDEERVKEVLSHYGYDEIGRTLNIEIAKGSDYQAWVCGDKTDCCMPFTSEKNQEYLLRDDLSYFVVNIEDENGDEDLVAQSVLVSAQEPDGTDVIAIDNIEIANRAIKYRPVIIEAYHKLREEIVSRYRAQNKPVKIVIGTSYNDDGGLITGECELVERTASPKLGKMRYSDWHEHGMNYLFHDSEAKENTAEKYFGLSADMLDRSKIKEIIKSNQEKEEIQALTSRISAGLDDGEGGLLFPDNYSCVIIDRESPIGYFIAADYIREEDEDDFVEFEKIIFLEDITEQDRIRYFQNFLTRRNFQDNEDLDGLSFKPETLKQNPFIENVLKQVYPDNQVKIDRNGLVTVRFER